MDRHNLAQTIVGCFILAVGLIGTLHILGLQAKITELQEKLADREVCPAVHVTCECPEYDEGWDDSEFAEGCTPEGLPYEHLEDLCEELLLHGNPEEIPGC